MQPPHFLFHNLQDHDAAGAMLRRDLHRDRLIAPVRINFFKCGAPRVDALQGLAGTEIRIDRGVHVVFRKQVITPHGELVDRQRLRRCHGFRHGGVRALGGGARRRHDQPHGRGT